MTTTTVAEWTSNPRRKNFRSFQPPRSTWPGRFFLGKEVRPENPPLLPISKPFHCAKPVAKPAAALVPVPGRNPLNPKSEVDRRHSSPSFGAQGLPALGAASLDAARIGTVSPCAPKHGTDCLALNFGFRVEAAESLWEEEKTGRPGRVRTDDQGIISPFLP